MNRQTTRWLRSVFITAALASLFTTTATAQDQLWLRQFGTSERDWATALAVDGAGGVMVAGFTEGSLGGPSFGNDDGFLARYDNVGNRVWITQIGSSCTDKAQALAPAGTGGVYVAGLTCGSLGGPFAGRTDAFVGRYDSQGNQLWMRQFGTTEREWVNALSPDGADGVYVAGGTTGELGGPYAGHGDTFLTRYDSDGNQLWVRQFGTSTGTAAFALAPDGAGGVMIAGGTEGSLGGPSAGLVDGFLARYDETGTQLWLRQFGTNSHDLAYALAPDSSGGVMVAGFTYGKLGASNAGYSDAYLARYDSAGNRLWIRQWGGNNSDVVYALASDRSGGVFVAGYFATLLHGVPLGGNEVFVSHYNESGDRLWMRTLSSKTDETAYAVASTGLDSVVVAGRANGDLGGPSSGRWDAFIARFGDFDCYHADCDQSTGAGVLDMLDFLCFQTAFMNGEEFACDCDKTTGPATCDIFDFLCFQNAFVGGCP